jgi:hypothetical protein
VGKHQFHVLHKPFGISKDAVVDPLQKTAVNLTIGVLEPGAVGIVDVTCAIGMSLEKKALYSESSDDGWEIGFHPLLPVLESCFLFSLPQEGSPSKPL